MTQQVRVKRVNPDGTVQVLHVRPSACSGDCHKCSGCGAREETIELTARDPIGTHPGDLVVMEAKTGPVLRAAAVLYAMPLVLFFLGYGLGQSLWQTGALWGGVAFALGLGLCVLYDRLVAGKKKTEYTITGFVSEP